VVLSFAFVGAANGKGGNHEDDDSS